MKTTEEVEMDVCRVALLFHESLMLEGLCTFLEDRPDMDVTSLSPFQPDAATNLKRWRPEVIIVDSEGVGQRADLALPRLLADNPEATLIDVNRHASQIGVYEHRTVRVGGMDDLVTAIATRGFAREQEGDV